MPTIPLGQAEPGMVVASDILDRKGRCLMPTGTELTQRTLDALENWGIAAIDVEGEEQTYEPDAVEVEAAKDSIAWRFARTPVNHPFMQVLVYEAAKAYLKSHADAPQPEPTDVP